MLIPVGKFKVDSYIFPLVIKGKAKYAVRKYFEVKYNRMSFCFYILKYFSIDLDNSFYRGL